MSPSENPSFSELDKLQIILERLKVIMTNLICIVIRLHDPATFYNNSSLVAYLSHDLYDIKHLFDELIEQGYVVSEEDARFIEGKMRVFLLIMLNSLL
jgi:hypothetical protein